MFNKTQFKKGDIVSLKSDLTSQLKVEKVWLEDNWSDLIFTPNYTEMLALSNNTTVEAKEVNYYSFPVNILALKNRELTTKIEVLDKTIEEFKKVFYEIKDKIIKKNKNLWIKDYYQIWNVMDVTTTTPQFKTLEERIEELEEKLSKKVKKTINKKSNKKKK